jgi:glycine oxidase
VSSPDVLILGGGIIGLSIARELANAGVAAEVLERLPAGAEASLAAAGMLSPLAETPADDPFFRACRASRDLWAHLVPALEEETGLSIDYDTEGTLMVAFDGEDERQLEQLLATAREVGEPAMEIEPADFHRLPDLSPAARRALFLPGEHRVDNVQAMAALHLAARHAGATLTYGAEVRQVRIAADGGSVEVDCAELTRRAARLVVAGGAWSGSVMGLPPLPVSPVRGQMLLLGGIGWPFQGSVRSGHGYAVRRGVTGLVVGSTAEDAGFAAHTTAGGIGRLLDLALRLFPALAGARLEATWAGLRPGTPDGWPLLGPLPDSPAIAATGHYRNGILLAPWTAAQIARLVTFGEAPDLAPFSPSRLAFPASAKPV